MAWIVYFQAHKGLHLYRGIKVYAVPVNECDKNRPLPCVLCIFQLPNTPNKSSVAVAAALWFGLCYCVLVSWCPFSLSSSIQTLCCIVFPEGFSMPLLLSQLLVSYVACTYVVFATGWMGKGCLVVPLREFLSLAFSFITFLHICEQCIKRDKREFQLSHHRRGRVGTDHPFSNWKRISLDIFPAKVPMLGPSCHSIFIEF